MLAEKIRVSDERLGLKILVASILIAISAQIRVPFYPIPFTLQTLVIFLLSATLGARAGMFAVLAYLFEGCCGLPVFSGLQGGIHRLFSHTGGYLIGFAIAAYVSGLIFERFSGLWSIVCGLFVGHALVLLCGYWQLSIFVGYDHAFQCGVYPFLLTDAIKIALGTCLIKLIK